MEKTATATCEQPKEALRFFPVPLSSIDCGALDMDLYIDPGSGRDYTLYCGKGSEYTDELRRRLIRNNHKFVYIPLSQHQAYRKVLVKRLDTVFCDPTKQRVERTRIVRESCSKMIEDALLFPERPESVAIIADVSRQFAEWSGNDNSEFSYLLDMAAHDYYTAMHMVNVGVGCGLLAKGLKPEDTEFHAAVIQGGLLHDIGKKDIPEALLNKEGRLDPEEWQAIRAHPAKGFDLIKSHPNVPEIVLDMIRLHHERVDGTGYPNGLSNSDIGVAARLCAIVDVFDALCSARPYRGPKSPAETLQIMLEGRGSHFDAELFDTWSATVGDLVRLDPDRAAIPPGAMKTDSPQAKMSIVDLLPTGTDDFVQTTAKPAATPQADNRRRHPRYTCDLTTKARIIEHKGSVQGQASEWVDVVIKDISQGGLQIIADWPIECNDVIEVDIPAKGREPVRRTARVAHVRPARRDEWCAGLAFLQNLD